MHRLAGIFAALKFQAFILFILFSITIGFFFQLIVLLLLSQYLSVIYNSCRLSDLVIVTVMMKTVVVTALRLSRLFRSFSYIMVISFLGLSLFYKEKSGK